MWGIFGAESWKHAKRINIPISLLQRPKQTNVNDCFDDCLSVSRCHLAWIYGNVKIWWKRLVTRCQVSSCGISVSLSSCWPFWSQSRDAAECRGEFEDDPGERAGLPRGGSGVSSLASRGRSCLWGRGGTGELEPARATFSVLGRPVPPSAIRALPTLLSLSVPPNQANTDHHAQIRKYKALTAPSISDNGCKFHLMQC